MSREDGMGLPPLSDGDDRKPLRFPTIGERDDGLPIGGYTASKYPIFDTDALFRRCHQTTIAALDAAQALREQQKRRIQEYNAATQNFDPFGFEAANKRRENSCSECGAKLCEFEKESCERKCLTCRCKFINSWKI